MGVAKGFSQLPKHLSRDETMELLKHIIPLGISDRTHDVRVAMIGAAQEAIAVHGEVRLSHGRGVWFVGGTYVHSVNACLIVICFFR